MILPSCRWATLKSFWVVRIVGLTGPWICLHGDHAHYIVGLKVRPDSCDPLATQLAGLFSCQDGHISQAEFQEGFQAFIALKSMSGQAKDEMG